MENINLAKARFLEIKETVKKLNIEAEALLLKIKEEEHTEGRGECDAWFCKCGGYQSGGDPGICANHYCGHTAAQHRF